MISRTVPAPDHRHHHRMRLLLVTTVAETLRGFLLPFARHFQDRGWQVDAMAHGAAGCATCLRTFDRVAEAPWARMPSIRHLSGRTINTIARAVTDGEYDIVHVHTPVAGFVTRYALRQLRHRPRVVYTAHGFHFHPLNSGLRNAPYILAEKLAGYWTDWLVVINSHDYNTAKRYRLVPERRIRLIRGIGVDISTYGTVPRGEVLEAARVAIPSPTDCRLFLIVGELNKGKRQADAIRALALVKDRNVHLALAGDGPCRSSLQALSCAVGVGERVHFLGNRDDIAVWLHLADGLIVTSEREGLPRCIMEAMCARVPVIGTRIRGVTDLLAEGAGILFEPGDIAALAQAMDKIRRDDPNVAESVQEAARRVADLSVERILVEYGALYREATMAS